MRTVLTIAGSDPSGGAGIEADIKVITAHACYAMAALTALTAQNTMGVRAIHLVPPAFVEQALRAVVEDMPVHAVKTGMLGSAQTVEAVAGLVREMGLQAVIVVDPVMMSTSGATLLPAGAVASLRCHLLPLAFILTPNLPEALLLLRSDGDGDDSDEALSDNRVRVPEDMIAIAQAVARLGPKYVYLKGGHVPFIRTSLTAAPQRAALATQKGEGEGDRVVIDVFYDAATDTAELLENPQIATTSTHGTGCALAAALASNLALGMPPVLAAREAGRYVHHAIATAPPGLGRGHGPINHLHSCYTSPFAPGHFLEYLTGHPRVRDAWHAYTRHEFVRRIGDGTLEREQFSYYLQQDYLFLTQFARAYSLIGAKAQTMDDAAAAARTVQHLHAEARLHVEYCASFGVSEAVMEAAGEDSACTAYTRYVLDIGHSHDLLALLVAMAPCLFGYADIGAWLLRDPATRHHAANPYYRWILTYGRSPTYAAAVDAGRALLERKARAAANARLPELIDIFLQATRLECDFWAMGLRGPP